MKIKLFLPFLGIATLAIAFSSSNSLAVAADSATTTKADKLFDDPVIARGKDFEITRSQLEDAFINTKSSAAAAGVNFNENERQMLEVRLLNDLIVSKILSARATDADKQRAREAAEKFISDARKQFSSEETFNAKLRLSKMTVEDLRQKLIKEATPSAVLERELKSQINITDAQVKNFYNDNPSKFEEPESIHVAHILIQTRNPDTGEELSDEKKADKRKQIEALLKRAKSGEDFGKLAREYSEDPGSRDNGGEYTFPRGQMVPPFEAAAFALKKGEISPVVTTDFGYHIIKQLDKKPARTVPLSEASERIKDYLTQQEGTKLAPAYFEKLRKEAGVEILDEELNTATKSALDRSTATNAPAKATSKP